MNHTPEPWPAFTDIAVMTTPDPEGTPVAILSWDDYIRARACVNACAGLDTEFLEMSSGNDPSVWTGAAIGRLRKQRDELLAALELWKETTLKNRYPYEHTAMLACDAAIARAKGGVA